MPIAQFQKDVLNKPGTISNWGWAPSFTSWVNRGGVRPVSIKQDFGPSLTRSG